MPPRIGAARDAVPATMGRRPKKLRVKEYGYLLARIRDYEEDHGVPLCLAGAPQDRLICRHSRASVSGAPIVRTRSRQSSAGLSTRGSQGVRRPGWRPLWSPIPSYRFWPD